MQIDESTERPTTPAGRRYAQHDVDLKLRQVDLQSLSNFLRRVETGPRLIMFTHLSIKRRYSEAGDKPWTWSSPRRRVERLKDDKAKKKIDNKTDKVEGKDK